MNDNSIRGRLKKYFLLALVTIVMSFAVSAQNYTLKSPNEQLSVTVTTGDGLSFAVDYKNGRVVEVTRIALERDGGVILGKAPRLKGQKMEAHQEKITPQVPNKDAVIDSRYNQLTMRFNGNYQVVFRAYDDGVAYRMVDQNKKTTTINNEIMDLTFPGNTASFFPQEESMYSHNERDYLQKKVSEMAPGDFCSLPVMFDTPQAKVLITESDLQDYPGMFLGLTTGHSFAAQFPKYVLKATDNTASGPDRNQVIAEEADFIAKVSGGRAFPWRVFIISDDDRTFVESNLVTQLASPSKLPDADWIKPGKVAWDWYNANNVYGVDFEAGINMDTYKYYIDFAAKNGIEYVILDEGWTKSTTEILESNDHLDVPGLIKYANSKNVDIILWVLWKPLYEAPDKILKLYSSWGAAGVKVDFIQRNDQYAVTSYGKIAEIAAGYKLLVDYHGAFKPAGIERVWPNIINYEGVKGNEFNKWSADIDPEHHVTIPFTRMAAGPMDFTPGAMINANQRNYENGGADYAVLFARPMALGTRAHQVAMYVVYEAPLQMLCESPTIYNKEQETVDFITQIPTTWDETVVLEGAVADYIIVARRKGDNWYIGAMTDWTARDFELNLSFLGAGEYQMQYLRDGINASRNAMDYKLETKTVSKDSAVQLNLSSGGGWTAILKKK